MFVFFSVTDIRIKIGLKLVNLISHKELMQVGTYQWYSSMATFVLMVTTGCTIDKRMCHESISVILLIINFFGASFFLIGIFFVNTVQATTTLALRDSFFTLSSVIDVVV